MEERHIPVRGDMFEAQVFSEGTGSPLLYLHTLPILRPDAPGLRRLAERHELLAPMHPGFAGSTGEEQLDDILDLAGYSFDLLDELGLESVPLIGHGFGGMIAAEMAAMDPSRVTKLVLVAPFGLWMEETPSPDLFRLTPTALAEHIFHDPTSEAAAAFAMPSSLDASSDPMIELTKSLASLGRFIWPLPDKGLKKRMHRVKSPTLVIWGEDDRLLPPAYGEAFRSRIRGARLEIVPDASHMLIVEQPDLFATLVEDFLQQ